MGKRAAVIPLVLLILAALLGWRVSVQDRRKHAPSGGSATIEGTETVVASKIAGRLEALSVDDGDRVKARQVVGRLECSEQQAALAAAQARLTGAQAQHEVAEAAVEQSRRQTDVAKAQIGGARAQEHVLKVDRERAGRDLDRMTRLHREGATSEVDLDNTSTRARTLTEQQQVISASIRTAMASSSAAAAGVRTALAQAAAAASQLVAAKADLERAQLAAAECNLIAPRDGIVTERLHEPGAVLPAAARVLTVVDLATVKLTFFVPDAELGRVKIGAAAEVRVDAYPKRAFTGKVRRIASEAEFTPRDVQTREDRDRLVYAVEVELENGEGLLRAGMPADVTLPGTGR
jgi:membrane fusion protein YbhG